MNLINNKTTFIFDLFHTLTGHESKAIKLPNTSTTLGIDRSKWRDQLFNHSKERLTGKVKDPFTIIKNMAHAIDPTIPDKKIREAVKIRIINFKDTLINIPIENLETLKELKRLNKTIGLISNADVMEKKGWELSPLKRFFDVAIFSCDVGYAKPDHEIYKICLTRLGKSPDECIFVGDGGSNELVAAKQLGFTTIFMSGIIKETYSSVIIEERMLLADHHIKIISELLEL